MVSVGVWQGASVGGIFEARSLESSLMFNAYFQKKFKGKFFYEKINWVSVMFQVGGRLPPLDGG